MNAAWLTCWAWRTSLPWRRAARSSSIARLDTAFVVDRRSATCGLVARRSAAGPVLRIVVRHALELSVLLEICGRDPVLCGLSAARTGALFASLEYRAGVPSGSVSYDAAFTSGFATRARIKSVRSGPLSRTNNPTSANANFSATASLLAAVWSLLGPAEYLMGKGGDGRLMLDPETGLNAYGCSPRPRPWAVTFASSTASSISERGYAAAETVRRRMLRDAIEGGIESSERNAAAEHPPGSRGMLPAVRRDADRARAFGDRRRAVRRRGRPPRRSRRSADEHPGRRRRDGHGRPPRRYRPAFRDAHRTGRRRVVGHGHRRVPGGHSTSRRCRDAASVELSARRRP